MAHNRSVLSILITGIIILSTGVVLAQDPTPTAPVATPTDSVATVGATEVISTDLPTEAASEVATEATGAPTMVATDAATEIQVTTVPTDAATTEGTLTEAATVDTTVTVTDSATVSVTVSATVTGTDTGATTVPTDVAPAATITDTTGTVPTAQATPTGGAGDTTDLPDRVVVSREGLFPEGVEYDPVNGRFFVSSTSEGTVYAVADDGSMTPFIVDDRIPSSVGLEVDEANNRLLVVATDMERLGFLGIYNLMTGENLAWVDFRPLLPTDPEHFTNDVAVDSAGNAYVTDSYAGVIYRVDPAGNAIVFLSDQSFSTQFALNGIDYHPTGDFLIAVRGTDLIKIPLANPGGFSIIQADTELVGADGIVLLDESTLAVVTNNPPRVFRLETANQFDSAQVTGIFEPGPVFPTTVASRDGVPYVLYAQLNAEERTVTDFPIQRVTFGAVPADE